jgi:hypothetical protein
VAAGKSLRLANGRDDSVIGRKKLALRLHFSQRKKTGPRKVFDASVKGRSLPRLASLAMAIGLMSTSPAVSCDEENSQTFSVAQIGEKESLRER